MANVTIRNLDDKVLAVLKRCAKAHNRSLEAELREALGNHADRFAGMQRLRRTARRIAANTPLQQSESAELLHQMREERER